MTPEERQQSLESARRARQWLGDFFLPGLGSPILREDLGCLLKEFDRLDANARRLRAGRPRIKTDNPKAVAAGRRRDTPT
jgi:hypothetical protein